MAYDKILVPIATCYNIGIKINYIIVIIVWAIKIVLIFSLGRHPPQGYHYKIIFSWKTMSKQKSHYISRQLLYDKKAAKFPD